MEQSTRLKFRKQIEDVKNLLNENYAFSLQINDKMGDLVDVNSSIHDFKILLENLENNRFELVVIGEFSTGKSTFINALIGQKVLPSKAQPTTATVNYIVHKTQHPQQLEEAIIFFEDGTQKSVPFNELSTYVTEMSEKINVVEEIKFVNIYIDSPFLEDGVVIVDTPGMESLHIKHDEITKKQIRRSNASIFLFDINRAGSRTEFEFISDVYESIDRIFFIANRADEVNLDEQTIEEVIKSIELKLMDNPYHSVSPHHAKVYPISALKALNARIADGTIEDGMRQQLLRESSIGIFEERLWDYLTKGEKINEILTHPLNRIEKFYEDVTVQLIDKLAIVKGELDVEAVGQEIGRLTENIETRKLALKDEKATIMRTVRDLIDDGEEKFEKKIDFLSTQLQSQLTNYEDFETFKNDFDRINERIKSRYLLEVENFLKLMKKNVLRSVVDKIQLSEEQLASEINIGNHGLNIQVGLRMLQKSDDTEIAFLRESLKDIEGEAKSVREKLNSIDDEIVGVQHNELIEEQIEKLYDHLEKQKTDLRLSMNQEPYYIEREMDRERKGAGILLTWLGVPETTKKVFEKNPRAEKLERDLERLQSDFDQKLSSLQSQKTKAQGSSSAMQMQIDKLEKNEKRLRDDFQNIRNQIMRKILDNQKSEVERMNLEIKRAIDEVTIGVKQQYHEIMDTLNVESVVSRILDQYFEDQDSIIVKMVKDLENQKELLNKSEAEQRQIEQRLREIELTINDKSQSVKCLKEQRHLAVIS